MFPLFPSAGNCLTHLKRHRLWRTLRTRRSTCCEVPGKIMNTSRPDAWFLASRTLLWEEHREMEAWKPRCWDLTFWVWGNYCKGTTCQFSLTRDAMSMSDFVNDLASTCHPRESSHSDAVRSLSSANPWTLRTAWHGCCRFVVHCEKWGRKQKRKPKQKMSCCRRRVNMKKMSRLF